MNGKKHSPLPWALCDVTRVYDGNGTFVCEPNTAWGDGSNIANAKLIAQAVNAHASLVEALEACVHALREIGAGRASSASALAFLASGQADVLALSKGEA